MAFARIDYINSSTPSGTVSGTTYSTFYPAAISLKNPSIITVEEVLQKEKAFGNFLLYDENQSFNIIEIKDQLKDVELDNEMTMFLRQGVYSITYYITSRVWTGMGYEGYSYRLTYTVSVVNNRLPLKKWTIADVVCRECETIEPLYMGEKPRFRLKGAVYGDDGNVRYYTGTAEKLNKILSPEFSFAKMNLRERLQQIGGRIHGEPRITDVHFEDDGKIWFEFDFDFYGSNKKSNIKNRHRITATTSTDINNFATSLDSSADNLISQLDWADGVVVEPFGFKCGSGISLRTEQTGARLAEDDSTYIPTNRPIYQAGEDFRLKCVYIPGVGYGDWDITPFLFEQSDYNLLSSYDGAFPFSKAFALHYTQGSKNIKGLFFKQPSAAHEYLKEYAITNILESVTGQKIKIEKEKGLYGQLQFVVEYMSINTARIKTNKSVIVGGLPRTMAYNQGANFIESRFYGENLKGAIARIGNPEKTYTYAIAFLSDIPKIGTKFDDEYYISSVSRELLPSYIKVTVSLSKHFNRKSQYVGINSNKRMWEVSERQSVDRQTNLTEYILINTNENEQATGKLIVNSSGTANLLLGTKHPAITVDAATVRFYDRKNNPCVDYRLALPVASLAMGNSLIFSFNLEDNYSAGQKLSNAGEDNGLGGLWGDYVPYADYYGRAWSYDFELLSDITGAHSYADTMPMEPPINHFNGDVHIKSNGKVRYRKDNREIPSFSVEFMCVTNDESIVIGSALTKNSLLVRDTNKALNLYGLRKELNVLDSVVDLSDADLIREDVHEPVSTGDITIIDGNKIVLPSVSTEYVAWALVTAPTETKIKVEDEDGTEITQTIYEGGELVIGQNGVGLNGQTLYFTPKRSVYD